MPSVTLIKAVDHDDLWVHIKGEETMNVEDRSFMETLLNAASLRTVEWKCPEILSKKTVILMFWTVVQGSLWLKKQKKHDKL